MYISEGKRDYMDKKKAEFMKRRFQNLVIQVKIAL